MFANTLAIIDRSTTLHDRDAFWLAKAMKMQALRVARAWGIKPPIVIPLDDERRLISDLRLFPIILVDDSKQATYLGLHTRIGNKPFAYIFVRTILNLGGGILGPGPRRHFSISGVTGHEVGEGMINEYLNIWINGPPIYGPDGVLIGDQYAREISDCTQDEIEIRLGWFSLKKKVHISNFYHPVYEKIDAPAGTQFDEKRKLTRPFSNLDSGYFILRNSQTGKITSYFGASDVDLQKFGSSAPLRDAKAVLNDYDILAKAEPLSRTYRLGANINDATL